METKVRLSKKWALDMLDLLKGGIVAALSSVLTLVYDLLGKGGLDSINWKAIGISFITVLIGYLIKNGAIEGSKVIIDVPKDVNPESVKAEVKTVV